MGFVYLCHDSMRQISINNETKLLELGKRLGLCKKDIERILKDVLQINEKPCLTLGPWWDDNGYGYGYYGTVSINDF